MYNSYVLFQFVVLYVGNGVEPDVFSLFTLNFKSEVGKPTVGCSTVPVLDVGRNMYNRAGQDLYGRFALFLIPTTTGHTD